MKCCENSRGRNPPAVFRAAGGFVYAPVALITDPFSWEGAALSGQRFAVLLQVRLFRL